MIVKANRVEVRDEGSIQGLVRSLDFTGSGISASVSGTVATVTVSGGTAPGLVLLSAYTPSGAATVDVTSQITSTYDQYLITYALLPATDNVSFQMRTSTDNGGTFTSAGGSYAYMMYGAGAGASAMTFVSSTSATTMFIGHDNSTGNATGEGVAGNIWIVRRGSATEYPFFTVQGGWGNTSTVPGPTSGLCVRLSAAAINAVRLFFSSGNLTGTARIYGLANT